MGSKILFILHFRKKFIQDILLSKETVMVSIATHFSIGTFYRIQNFHILKDILVLIKRKIHMNTTSNHKLISQRYCRNRDLVKVNLLKKSQY